MTTACVFIMVTNKNVPRILFSVRVYNNLIAVNLNVKYSRCNVLQTQQSQVTDPISSTFIAKTKMPIVLLKKVL